MTPAWGNMEIFGLPDLGSGVSAWYDADSEASADYPEEALRTEVPSDTWRAASYTPEDATFALKFLSGPTSTIPTSLGGVGLVNHNLWPWTGKVRFLFESLGVLDFATMYELVIPTALTNTTNVTGAVGDIDNKFGVSGSELTPTVSGTQMSFIVQMGTPSDTPRTGAGYQICAVKVRASANGAPANMPRVQVQLKETGSAPIKSLGTKMICLNTGYWIFFEFNAADLTDPTGASVEFYFIVDNIDTGIGTIDGYIDEVLWVCESQGISTSPTLIHDSGWLEVGSYIGNPLEDTKYLPVEITRGDCLAYNVFNPDTYPHRELTGTVESVRVLIREDHSPDVEVYNVASMSVRPPGYVEVGHMVACGAVFIPEVNFTVGPIDGIRDLSSVKFTLGGNQYGSRSGTLRTAVVDLPALTLAEKAFIMDRVLRRRGVSQPLLVRLTPDDPLESEALTFYATISQQETVASTQLQADYGRRLTLNLVEFR